MKRSVAVLLCFVFAVACSAPQTPQEERTLPEPLFARELPEAPAEVAASKRIVEPVKTCEVEVVEGEEWRAVGPGVFMSFEMAKRAADTKIAYDEMRDLYEVDLRTMEREREVYQRQLDLADQEVARQRERARRTWWERNRGWVGLGVGLVVGAGLAIGMAAALDGVTDAVE